MEVSDTNVYIENIQVLYQNRILAFDQSLESYNIDAKQEPILYLYPNQKGGGSGFFTFFLKNPILVIICLLI
jgi:hypothetical protein